MAAIGGVCRQVHQTYLGTDDVLLSYLSDACLCVGGGFNAACMCDDAHSQTRNPLDFQLPASDNMQSWSALLYAQKVALT